MNASVSFKRGQRAAALWVAGVGAALVVAAAALFVAVRWNDLPPEAKLAVILGLTGAFLLAGFSIRRTLPTTGGVLYHLGAFLLPIDLGAINLRIGLRWEELLLAEGILGVVAFSALGMLWRSEVLRWAAALSVVVFALGVGGTTVAPAALVLAVCAALLSVRLPRATSTLTLATLAGFASVYAFVLAQLGGLGQQIAMLGLDASSDPFAALAAGAVAAFVIGRAAHLGRDVALAFLAIGAFVASATTAWLGADAPSAADTLVGPSVFVVIQIAALALTRDPFWSRPVRWIATGTDVIVALFALGTIGFVAVAPLMESSLLSLEPDRVLGVAFALLGVGSVLAAVRYDRRSLRPATLWAAISAATFGIASAQLGTASTIATAVTMIAAAGLLFALRDPVADAAAALCALYAVPTTHDYPAASFLVAGAGAALLALAAMMPGRAQRVSERVRLMMLAATAVLTLGTGAIIGARATGGPFAGLVFVLACWLLALTVDLTDRQIASIPRFAAALVVFAGVSWAPSDRLVVITVLLALLVIDSLRRGDPQISFAAVLPLQIAVSDVGRLAGLELAHVGVVVSVAAVVWMGLGEAIGGRWRVPLRSAAVLGTLFGMALAWGDPAAFGATVIIAGGLALGGGVLVRDPLLTHTGGAMLAIGTWIELATGGVASTEAYVAPVAAHLLLAGWWARRSTELSSWAAYAPAVAMVGGAGVVERISGGGGWHAIVAGAVGVAAVASGGWRKLAGPLFTGTALLAVVAGYESLGVVATVPTWGWLALGGSALLATGVALERADTSPAEAGRRVVDVIATNFD